MNSLAMARILKQFAYLSLTCTLILTLAALAGWYPTHKTLGGYIFALTLMAVVSAAMLVASRLALQHDPRGEKALPSSVVAYLLFIVMTVYWLNYQSALQ